MASVLILGGTGRVAMLLERLLVAQGHTVTAVLHNPNREREVAATGAAPIVIDMETVDVDGFKDLASGNDAVVWTAGSGGGDPARTYAVDRDAAMRAVDGATAAGVWRFIMLSWAGSRADHGVPEDHFLFPYAEAKWAADEYLGRSRLGWTILGPGTLNFEEPTGRIETDPDGGEVSRADVAAVIAASLADDSTVGRMIRFSNGETPIAEALSLRG